MLIALTAKGVELFVNKQRYATLNQQIVDLFAETYPGESVPSNPRLFFERRMGADQGPAAEGSTFLEALRAISDAKTPAADVRAANISFNADVMNIEILATDVPTLDGLRERINDSGAWEARLTQTSPEDDKTIGRLQVQRSAE